eukprot:27860_1
MSKKRHSLHAIYKIISVSALLYLLYIVIFVYSMENTSISSNILIHVSSSNTRAMNIRNHSTRNSIVNVSSLVSEMVSNLAVLKYNGVYRVGNLLYQWGKRWKMDIAAIRWNPAKYNHTLLYKYFNSANTSMIRFAPNQFDVPLFRQIIDDYIISASPLIQLPSDDELVVHIRAGDVLRHRDTQFIPLINETINKYQNINKITFVTVLNFAHDVHDKETSKWIYTEAKEANNRKKLTRLFCKIIELFPHLSYKMISNENVDRDIVYLTKAKYLIRNRGTFDHVITKLNQNIIINAFDDKWFFK